MFRTFSNTLRALRAALSFLMPTKVRSHSGCFNYKVYQNYRSNAFCTNANSKSNYRKRLENRLKEMSCVNEPQGEENSTIIILMDFG